ncbi:helix-turn-helix transcriptional regulator [Galbibacter sp. PAP.153]|uniref:helix-turn-helix domain-containing protein n=1 Tax=Galbibacter sp. PAP.153 TaxID=3104623 RepID=UPI003008FCCE
MNLLEDHLVQHDREIRGLHKHDFFLVVIFTSGSGFHEIDFNTYEVKPGSIFMLRPGQTHYWKLSKNSRGYIFFHDQYFYESPYLKRSVYDFPFYGSIHNPPFLYLDVELLSGTVVKFKELLSIYKEAAYMINRRLQSLTDLIYSEISEMYLLQENVEKVKSNVYLKQFRAFEGLLEEFYRVNRYPSYYAEKMHITPKHLNRIVKTTIGKSATELINERVLLEAKRMIVSAVGSLSEIAYSLGFEDYAYFSRWFKLRTGKEPSKMIKG